MTHEELLKHAKNMVSEYNGTDTFKNDCDIIVFLLENCEINIPEENRFFAKINCKDINFKARQIRKAKYLNSPETARFTEGEESLAYTGTYDFSHTCPEWDSISHLGFWGLRNRIEEYAQKNKGNELRAGFYENLLRVYDAALCFMKRVSDEAVKAGKTEIGESLLQLCKRSPESLYEILQTSIIYYTFQQFLDGTGTRTLGRLDSLLYPYYTKTDENEATACISDYLKEIDRLEAVANIPFALCGTDEAGNDLTNELSYIILDTYAASELTNTKLHILCSESTPDEIIKKAFRHIRDGKNSIVFMSDGRIIEALKKHGAAHEDAARYHVVGCYECGSEGELTCSCNARVNIPKALELALNGGKDMLSGKQIGLEVSRPLESFEDVFSEFERQLAHLCDCAMRLTDIHEARYPYVHSSPFLTSTYTSALEKGGDLYCDYTAKYNNSSLNGIGLATATDSLVAVRKAVFEDKIISLQELTDILKSDWQDKEYLRLLFKNKYPKYGRGDRSVDATARRITDSLSGVVSNKPNAKGGIYRLGLFSIDWRWAFGEKTAASADGRHAGDTLSQNTSANFGADREGATAHLISAASIDTVKTPNGAIVDIDLHSSAVRGENGIEALLRSLRGYFSLGGFAVHYNVLDTDTLIDAKKNPTKYPSLQVRLCGWNVLFSSLTEREKDEFIARSIK